MLNSEMAVGRKAMEKAEAAWNAYEFKDIPQVTKTAFLEGFVEGYTKCLTESSQTLREYFHNNPENNG